VNEPTRNMHTFGVCCNTKGCDLSYISDKLTPLFDLLRAINGRRNEGRDIDELLPQLDRFERFFQEGHACLHCGGSLIQMTQPTAGLVAGSEDYKRAVRANLVMEALSSLQGLGKLPL
jgi:hypothetical protein